MKHIEPTHQSVSMPYKNLLIMVLISFVLMFILMYAMVDSFSNVIANINQVYMAGLMAAPMAVLEIVFMRAMYKNKKWNIVVIIAGIVFSVLFFLAIRKQTAVSDRQFLKSMIPHHAGAILMCNESNIKDPEIKKLCEEIIKNQEKEIAQMKELLEKTER